MTIGEQTDHAYNRQMALRQLRLMRGSSTRSSLLNNAVGCLASLA